MGPTLLLMARTLEPDPRGFGTHQQIGLAPCYFQGLTGKHCPLCGGTTAWALIARGKPMQAARSNLGATLLCMVVVIVSPLVLIAAANGQRPRWWPTWRYTLLITSAWLVVVVLDWVRRLF